MKFLHNKGSLWGIYTLASLTAVSILTAGFHVGTTPKVEAQGVPSSYYPNYQIQSQWGAILDSFVELEAKRKIGEDPSSSTFSEINNNLRAVIPSLPSESEYKIIYEQCLLLSSSVARGYTYDKFINFMENCFSPLNRAIKEISNKFTMKPSISANPTQGSAPLTVTFDAKGSTDPSNDTIPSSNFFRYFKDTNGVDKIIGQ